MINDGNRVRLMLSNAQNEAIICAPYIKLSALEKIVKLVPNDVLLKVYMNLRAIDVYLGVTDIGVYDFCKNRHNTYLYNIQNLHAKLYSADEIVLIGSANVTNSALGWVSSPNVEILCPGCWEDPSIRKLSFYMKTANLIDSCFIDKTIVQLQDIEKENLNMVHAVEELASIYKDSIWLPDSSMPENLYKIYSGRFNSNSLTSGAIRDAESDIKSLNFPPDLDKKDFYIFAQLQLMEAIVFSEILDSIPGKVSEADGIKVIKSYFPFLEETDCRLHWNNIILWVSEFFGDRFEMAPVSFELRLK